MRRKVFAVFVILLLLLAVLGGQQQEHGQGLVEQFLSQTQEPLQQFTALCHMEGGNKWVFVFATMDVKVEFSNGIFTYKIVKESGFESIRNKLFREVLKEEKERLEQKTGEDIALSDQNYSFTPARTEKGLQVLLAVPRRHSESLLPRTLFVDSSGALVRSRAKPLKSPHPSLHNVVVDVTYEQMCGTRVPVCIRATGKYGIIGGAFEVRYLYKSVNGTEVTGAK